MEFFGKLRSIWPKRTSLEVRPFNKPVAIVADGCGSSIAYFVKAELVRRGWESAEYSLSAGPPPRIAEFGCRTVILVRYVKREWMSSLREFVAQGGKVVYFMDDDLFDTNALAELPKPYARKIRTQATVWQSFLREVCAEIWVSSDYLLEKYSDWPIRRVLASPLRPAERSIRHRIFYHGSSSHYLEIRWLVQIISKMQTSRSDVWFEIFGDQSVNKIFRSIPNVSILHPMSWDNYCVYSSAVKSTIGLAPLLPSRFNSARSVTKFFDFARMGAFGIYSDVPPYNAFVRDGVDGILLPNNPERWFYTIDELLRNPSKMEILAQNAGARVNELAKDCRYYKS